MPITPAQVTAAILSATPDLSGQDWARIATVVGVATVSWALLPGSLVLNGVTTGSTVTGQVPTGKLFIPTTVEPLMVSCLAAGLAGLVSPAMARGISVGVGSAFSATAAYVAVSAGVGIGTDLSKVTFCNSATLVGSFASTFTSFGMTGINIPRMATAYGVGIANQMLLGTGFGPVVPVTPLPTPGVGVSFGFQVY